MQFLIQNNDAQGAAQIAMNNPNFYSIVLKNWAKTMTNVDANSRVEFNDFTATVIGMIRDNKPFDQVLYADILYTDNGTSGVTPYARDSNDHYKELEDNKVNFMTTLQERVQ
ncbi:MAG: hypothetical protein HOM21_09515, partial [Halobacteriovoraceae bacterium]|nr:hypothetical protein [Halobacteriovoraceae bacterium]